MPMPDRADLSSVVMPKDRVIEIVAENLAAHEDLFHEAMEGYETRSIELLMQHIERIKKGKRERIVVALPVPENHSDDYERVLSMLRMDTRDEVQLDGRSFDQYVRDNWTWKQEFLTTTASYTTR